MTTQRVDAFAALTSTAPDDDPSRVLPTSDTLRIGVPLAVMLTVIAADVAGGSGQIVFGLLCAVPLLASQLDRPRAVIAWGVLCVVVELLLGLYDNAYEDDAAVFAQTVRVGFAVLMTAVGALLSARRLVAEQRLLRLTAVASAAQLAILPPLPRRVGAWSVAVDYTAADEESRVGGDFYDAMLTDHGLLVLVGDSRGKGLAAVRLAALVLGTFRHPSSLRADALDVFASLAETVELHGEAEDFVTAVLVQLTGAGQCRVINAGHPPPLLVTDAAVRALDSGTPAPPLGLLDRGRDPHATDFLLQPGDRLVLHTDGLSECRRPQDRLFFPVQREIQDALTLGELEEGVTALRDRATAWAGGSLTDDVAILAVEQPHAR